MKPWFYIPLLLLCLLTAPNAHAQNLVPNHSFEEYTECPTGTSQIEKANGWKAYGVTWGTPDFFHECSTDTFLHWVMAGVPYNAMGHRYAKDGAGYAGVYTYSWPDGNGLPFREIIGIKLHTPLEVGVEYFISFWVSPGYGSYSYVRAFSNKIGARFSMNEYSWHPWDPFPPAPIDNFAHVYTDSIITDTNRWHLISGSFIADKPYPYLMLGNLYDDMHTDTIGIPNSVQYLAYYYIDDICVSSNKDECPLIDPGVDTTQGNNDDCLDAPIQVFPNPTADDALLTFNCQWEKWVRIFDATGRLIHQQTLPEEADQYRMDCSSWAKGMYLVVVEWNNQRQSVKLIVQ